MKDFKQLKYEIKSRIPKRLYPLLIEYYYYKRMGKLCNLNNPQSFSEKVQWSKLYRQNPLITNLSDKIRARDWVKEKIGEEYLIPRIGSEYKSLKEIDFDNLPSKFVIKTNHGCGCNILVQDKSFLDIEEAERKMQKWLKHNYAYDLLELQYKNITPRIYIEQNLMSDEKNGLTDYKFFCFSGKVFCLYVMVDGYPEHRNSKLGIFDREFRLMPYTRKDFKPIKEQLQKPQNFEKMVEIAEKMSEGFSHVRVDLYNVEGKIYFGEMTFTTGGGVFKHVPEVFDEILGNQWDIYSGI